VKRTMKEKIVVKHRKLRTPWKNWSQNGKSDLANIISRSGW